MNINLKNEKGITMVAIVITIVILLIIVSTVSFSSKNGIDMKNINNMYSDIIILEEKIASYYLKYDALPIKGSVLVYDDLPDAIKNTSIYPNNNEEYYIIDLSLIDNISLNNARDASNASDVYIINTQSHIIYYLKGVSVEEYTSGIKKEEKNTYYTIPRDYTQIDMGLIENTVLSAS